MNADQSGSPAREDTLWRVGEVIDGLYEVRQVITSGGMGVVHRVHHRGWNMDLAVKTPRPELVSSPGRVADFETEAQTWVGLGLHPHVVSCVYVRRLDGPPGRRSYRPASPQRQPRCNGGSETSRHPDRRPGVQ